jgi:hypothetical protein
MPILNPKQRAQAMKGFITKHRDLVDSMQFQMSLDYAEAQYVHTLCELAPSDIRASSTEQAAAACFQRILGMHDFIKVMKNLSEKPSAAKQQEQLNLDHTK